MPQVRRVQECELCGEVCTTMDTSCARCQRYGTLRKRLQCTQCRRLLDDETCWACTPTGGIQDDSASKPVPQPELANKAAPAGFDPAAVPPWVAPAVGGTVFGAIIGAIAAVYLGEGPIIGGVVGGLLGAILGALLGRR